MFLILKNVYEFLNSFFSLFKVNKYDQVKFTRGACYNYQKEYIFFINLRMYLHLCFKLLLFLVILQQLPFEPTT